MTPSSTRKFSPSGCLLILTVQPDRSRPLKSECHSPSSAARAPAAHRPVAPIAIIARYRLFMFAPRARILAAQELDDRGDVFFPESGAFRREKRFSRDVGALELDPCTAESLACVSQILGHERHEEVRLIRAIEHPLRNDLDQRAS